VDALKPSFLAAIRLQESFALLLGSLCSPFMQLRGSTEILLTAPEGCREVAKLRPSHQAFLVLLDLTGLSRVYFGASLREESQRSRPGARAGRPGPASASLQGMA